MSERAASVALVAVGDELLAGAHPDTNSPEVARGLARLGLSVALVQVVPDEEQPIASAVTRALEAAPLVLVTGGLGPTLDDVTRQGVARAMGRALVASPEALAELAASFEARGRPIGEANRRQVLLPEGAALVRNRVGTAPGFRVEDARGAVVCLPGPPAEMRVVLEEQVLPWLAGTAPDRTERPECRFHLSGLPESEFAERVGAWMERGAEPRMGCTVERGVLSVVLRASGAGPEPLRLLEARAAAFRERFAAHIFDEREPRLERVLGAELIASGTPFTVAESCTGGLVCALLTEVPGISAVFARGFVTYADAAKTRDLGVSAELLERHGAVSEEVAIAMARGAQQAAGARLALAVTGVAGPDGGTPQKPVGLVWFGVAWDDEVHAESRRFPPGERTWIRALAARHALFLGLRCLRRARAEAAPD